MLVILFKEFGAEMSILLSGLIGLTTWLLVARLRRGTNVIVRIYKHEARLLCC